MASREALPAERREITLYFSVLMLTLGLADPLGIVNLPILYILKDDLGLRPPAVAAFEAITLLPVYAGFLFGAVRDRWQPRGLGDRAYLLWSAPVAIAGYLWLAANPLSYAGLLTVILLVTIAFQFMDTATEALITLVSQHHGMTGRLSALTEIADVIPGILAMLAGGWLATHASSDISFVLAAAFTAVIALHALWRPRAVFALAHAPTADRMEERATFRRLLQHPPLWPTVAILAVWNFSPGWGIPFLYYASEEIGLSAEAFGLCRAVNLGCIAVTTLAYAVLCQRQPLGQILRWGIALNIFPGALFLLISDAPQAVAVSAAMGLAFGFTNVGLIDLLRRASPQNLEGSATMLGFSALTAAGAVGELVGSVLYDHGGFVTCLAIDALATALIFPLLRRIPAAVLEAREDGCERHPVGAIEEAA